MKTTTRLFSIFTLLAIFTLAFATPVLAFEGRTGDEIIIEADEIIDDDLYVNAQDFTLEGTVTGDLFVVGENITINGTVEGDLFAGGQTIVINGTVGGDTRIGGAALQLGETASLGEDLMAGGASLETKEGSTTGGDLLVGSGQTLLAGDVAGDVFAGTGALELRGNFAGNVTVEVGDADQTDGHAPPMYLPDTSVSIPSISAGFTIKEGAKIEGDLTYAQFKDIKIPSGAVAGKVTRNEPTVDIENTYVPPTSGELAAMWIFDLFRSIATIILLGLLLVWLAPKFVNLLSEKIQATPIASVGWGLVACAAFFFTLLLILVAMIIGALFFGVLTLGGVSFWIIMLGLLSIFALCIGFGLIIFFLAQIVVAWLGGKMILNKLNPKLAESKIWPLVLGAVLVALLTSLPLVDWVFSILIVLAGLGAFWIWGQEARQTRQIAVV
jgi:cytoskeletal protein CcmA (bactofilin family)